MFHVMKTNYCNRLRLVSVQKCTKPFKNGHSEKPAIYGFH